MRYPDPAAAAPKKKIKTSVYNQSIALQHSLSPSDSPQTGLKHTTIIPLNNDVVVD